MNNRTRITRSPSARRLLILAGCCAAFLCLTAPLSAASVLDTSGFEGYFSGPLPGQLEGNLPWKTIGSGGGSAWVETTSGVNNTHGVRVDRAANSNDWWAVSYSGQGLPNSRFLFIDWDMRVNNTNAGAVEGPFIGMEAYDDSFFPQLLATLGVDATSRDVLYQTTDALVASGATVDEDWHHYQIGLDFALDQYSLSLDYAPLTDQPVAFPDGASNTFADADIAVYEAASSLASKLQAGTGFFDNLVVRDSTPGDFNTDGVVDAADYTLWRDNLGAADESAIGFNGDGGGVTQTDYGLWLNHYGIAYAPQAALSPAPEPAAALLLAAALGCSVGRRGGRKD